MIDPLGVLNMPLWRVNYTHLVVRVVTPERLIYSVSTTLSPTPLPPWYYLLTSESMQPGDRNVVTAALTQALGIIPNRLESEKQVGPDWRMLRTVAVALDHLLCPNEVSAHFMKKKHLFLQFQFKFIYFFTFYKSREQNDKFIPW